MTTASNAPSKANERLKPVGVKNPPKKKPAEKPATKGKGKKVPPKPGKNTGGGQPAPVRRGFKK